MPANSRWDLIRRLRVNVPINLHSHVGVIYLVILIAMSALVILIAMSAETVYRVRRDPVTAIFLKNCVGSYKFRNLPTCNISTADKENSVKMLLGSLQFTGLIGLS